VRFLQTLPSTEAAAVSLRSGEVTPPILDSYAGFPAGEFHACGRSRPGDQAVRIAD